MYTETRGWFGIGPRYSISSHNVVSDKQKMNTLTKRLNMGEFGNVNKRVDLSPSGSSDWSSCR